MVSDSTRVWFQELVHETQQRLGALDRLQDDPARFHGRAELHDGVTAVVAPGGALVDLSLSPASMRLSHNELATTIAQAQRQALQDANRRYAAAVQEATGHGVDVTAMVERRLDTLSMREAADTLERSRDERWR